MAISMRHLRDLKMVATSNQRRQLLSVAPMMDWTDVHYRQLARIISKHTWLYTEMVVDKTILHTPHLDRFLSFPIEQSPIVLQIGGSDPKTLAAACEKAKCYGYDEVNLNCGCPSDRVAGAGCFGASLMKEPQLVAQCMKAMAEALGGGTPVTVKCRLGVDDIDSYSQLKDFVSIVSEGSPATHFVIHARKCFLAGLNPAQNRSVPPLRHEWVYSLKRDFPHLIFSLNGGVQNVHEARALIDYLGPFPSPGYTPPQDMDEERNAELNSEEECEGGEEGASQSRSDEHRGPSSEPTILSNLPPVQGGLIEGVMIGRAAYNDPWGCLGDADRALFGKENASTSRRQVFKAYTEYADAVVGSYGTRSDGLPDPNVRALVKPLLGMFYGEAGSKKWKNAVDTVLKSNPPSLSFLLDATLHHIPDAVLDAPPKASNSFPKIAVGPMATEEDQAGGGKTIGELKRLVVTGKKG